MSSFSCSSKIVATANYNHCVLLMYMCMHVQMQKYQRVVEILIVTKHACSKATLYKLLSFWPYLFYVCDVCR